MTTQVCAIKLERNKSDNEMRKEINRGKARIRTKKYREKNKDKVKASVSAWADKNKDKIKIKDAKWKSENSERVARVKREWTEKNKEKIAARMKVYASENKGALKIIAQNRRAKKQAGGILSKGIAEKLMVMQKGKCVICRKNLNGDFQLDHIIPIALGGLNIDENIQLLHGTCNRQKHARDPIVHMQSLGLLI